MTPPHSWRVWRSAWFWIAVMAIAIFVARVGAPGFESVVAPDTQGYRWKFERHALSTILELKRTPGYPLFLEVVRRLTGDHALVAHAQLGAFLAAAAGFGAAVQAFSGSRLTALAAAVPLLFARMIPMQATRIMSDMLAAGAAVATLALLLVVVARPASKTAWAGLGLALFYTYQVRPACLFLIVLVPLLGLALTLLRDRGVAWRAALRRPFTGLCLLSLVPFLLWCGLRWAVVGHFGLVSFGGANLIGITASMVTPQAIPGLPAEYRPFARMLLKWRHRKNLPPLEQGYSHARWCSEYNTNAHIVAPRALRDARSVAPPGVPTPWVKANRFYTRFSVAMIRTRPDLYRRWLADGGRYTYDLLARDRLVRGSAIALLVSFFLWGLGRLGSIWFGRGPEERSGSSAPSRRVSPAAQLLVVAVAFFLASQALVMLVEVPLDRYTFLSALFLPGAFLALAVEMLRSTAGLLETRFRHRRVTL